MKELFKHFLAFFNGTESTAFQYGYLTGAAVSVLVVLLIFFLILLMRSSAKCKGITLASPGGNLFITASAVGDLVKATEKDFPALQVVKTVLVDKRASLSLQLRVNFPQDQASAPLPVIADALREKIFANLQNTFGIDHIKEINIEVQRGKKA